MVKERKMVEIQDLPCENMSCGYLNKETCLCTFLCQRDAWAKRETCAERVLDGQRVRE